MMKKIRSLFTLAGPSPEIYTASMECFGAGREKPVHIPDFLEYSVEDFVIPSHYADEVSSILLPRGLILDRIERLAHDIRTHYGDVTIHMVCVLKGSRLFFSELCAALARLSKCEPR